MRFIFNFETEDSLKKIYKRFKNSYEKYLVPLDETLPDEVSIIVKNENYSISFSHSFKEPVPQHVWTSFVTEAFLGLNLKTFNYNGTTKIETKLLFHKDNGLRNHTFLIINAKNQIIY